MCIVTIVTTWTPGLLHSWDLHESKETMVFEAHGVSFPRTKILLLNYNKVCAVFHSMEPLGMAGEKTWLLISPKKFSS